MKVQREHKKHKQRQTKHNKGKQKQTNANEPVHKSGGSPTTITFSNMEAHTNTKQNGLFQRGKAQRGGKGVSRCTHQSDILCQKSSQSSTHRGLSILCTNSQALGQLVPLQAITEKVLRTNGPGC